MIVNPTLHLPSIQPIHRPAPIDQPPGAVSQPVPEHPPSFSRPVVESSPHVVGQIWTMLENPDVRRVNALIITLTNAGSKSLDSALARHPERVTARLLTSLAVCGTSRNFLDALHRTPSLCTQTLVDMLVAADAPRRRIEAASRMLSSMQDRAGDNAVRPGAVEPQAS